MAKIVILGSGGWGIALAIIANSNGNQVTLWTPFDEEAEMLNTTRESTKLLSGIKIPEEIKITTDIYVASGADMVIIAVPSFAVEETARKLGKVGNIKLVVNVAKGLQKGSCERLSEVITRHIPTADFVVLSGPSHAEEVARKEPTSLVAASNSITAAEFVQRTMMCETLRIYTGDDAIGVELGGAFKNIIAVAAGICDGMGLGDNPKAALMTRGLSEIARLGVKLGARQETFAGLTGLGDLVVTCTSEHSRNRRYGSLVGSGRDPKEALSEVGTVEGYYAAAAAVDVAEKLGVEMPICRECYEIMYNNADCREALKILMNRPKKTESEF